MKQETELIKFGVPSKDPLYSGSVALLERAGLNYRRAGRELVAESYIYPLRLNTDELRGRVMLVFMRPDDIVQKVADGELNLGISGGDIVDEMNLGVDRISPLNFGRCTLSALVDTDSLAEKSQMSYQKRELKYGLTVASKYQRLASYWYDQSLGFKVIPASGALEGWIRAGWADAIVDLVESGKSAQDNKLSVVRSLKEYQAELITASRDELTKPSRTLTQNICLADYYESKGMPNPPGDKKGVNV